MCALWVCQRRERPHIVFTAHPIALIFMLTTTQTASNSRICRWMLQCASVHNLGFSLLTYSYAKRRESLNPQHSCLWFNIQICWNSPEPWQPNTTKKQFGQCPKQWWKCHKAKHCQDVVELLSATRKHSAGKYQKWSVRSRNDFHTPTTEGWSLVIYIKLLSLIGRTKTPAHVQGMVTDFGCRIPQCIWTFMPCWV